MTKTFLLTGETFSADKKNIFTCTQYQSCMLEMFYMRDNFFDPRVLMQIHVCDKTDLSSRHRQFLAGFMRLDKTFYEKTQSSDKHVNN